MKLAGTLLEGVLTRRKGVWYIKTESGDSYPLDRAFQAHKDQEVRFILTPIQSFDDLKGEILAAQNEPSSAPAMEDGE